MREDGIADYARGCVGSADNMFLLDLLYPPRCTFCHDFVKNGKILICEKCKENLPRTLNAGRQKTTFVSACIAPFYYEKYVKESLHRFKFFSCTGYARAYAPYLADLIREEFGDSFDLITWVPISRKRMKKRGYDQAKLLAQAVGKLLGTKPVRTLRKVRDTPPQSLAGDAEKRRNNIAGAYAVWKPQRFVGKRILIIDDIITTGSTISECARMLGKAGADQILCATVARSRS